MAEKKLDPEVVRRLISTVKNLPPKPETPVVVPATQPAPGQPQGGSNSQS